ncbi:hypothetical protein BJF78_27925 [Pseudonocardia sp. CNS-139]|nr:hypothetical protein BJF78_27925 [Pseudonocardia sp. CNS-139]
MLPDPVPAGGRPFTVLTFNTFLGDADADELAALIEARRPDVVALTETGVPFANRLSPLVAPLG